MASALPLSAPSTTPAPSSAWSRLVQITRTASEGSRNKAPEPSSQLNRSLPPGTHTSSSAAPAKKRRQVESPPARSVTKYLAPLSPEPHDLPKKMPPEKSKKHTCCSPNGNKHECITACPCRVEDVDCVASQEPGVNDKRFLPRGDRQPPTTAEDPDQDRTPPKSPKALRRGTPQRVRNTSPRPDELETKRSETLTHFGEQHISRDSEGEAETEDELAIPATCSSARLENHVTVAKTVLEPGEAVEDGSSSITGPGLHEGDHNSANKTPVPKSHSPSPAGTDESIQLATPSSSPTTKTDSQAKEAPVEATKPHGPAPAPAPKTKRRLTLHGDSYGRHSSHKKRKTAPKRKDGVQTTLSLAIGSSAGMRECKLCDTVYNPFHPEDVKVHTKRHAIAVKRERRSEETTGPAVSLVD
ncbi:hypothetical protein KVR01_007934 [Diaporthe batatas]|uniref:uncharacterized protein n=1 Tax=Diaporthe batatas TaxID=748121 RepID=UPI001D0511DD|nr:uncharacterized protein KVR01_007934 [Diaporthe batatas]KAG8162169.1 hypothetical protein KVR01_007934 [Diaporthe batatas]